MGSVVLLHNMGNILAGQEEVSWVVELQVHRVFVLHGKVILGGKDKLVMAEWFVSSL